MSGLKAPSRPEAIRSFAWKRKRISFVIIAMIISGWSALVEKIVQRPEGDGQVPPGERRRQIENGVLLRPADDGLHVRRLDLPPSPRHR